MSKWAALNEMEEELLRSRGIEPVGVVVNRVSMDQRVFLKLKTREEIYVRIANAKERRM